MKVLIISLTAIFLVFNSFAQQDPWKKEEIMPAKVLAAKIQSTAGSKPVILNVGPMENIKTAINIGVTSTAYGINKLAKTVSAINKNTEVVIYCGCCSYENCPNIKPAFKKLKELGFKNVKLLDLPVGIQPDWIAKGYPVEKK